MKTSYGIEKKKNQNKNVAKEKIVHCKYNLYSFKASSRIQRVLKTREIMKKKLIKYYMQIAIINLM